MTKLTMFSLSCALAGFIAAPEALQASGSYCACLPKPPTTTGARADGATDRDRYDLGQKIFNGKAALTQAQAGAADQRTRLQAIQAQLPARVAKKKDLPNLAGRLTEDQLAALEYFVARRYPQAK